MPHRSARDTCQFITDGTRVHTLERSPVPARLIVIPALGTHASVLSAGHCSTCMNHLAELQDHGTSRAGDTVVTSYVEHPSVLPDHGN